MAAALPVAVLLAACGAPDWSARELALIESLQLGRLGAPPADPSNRYADDPRAVALGRALFHDPALSATGEVACSSCHRPERYFADGRRLSVGIAETRRHAPGLLGVGYGRWFYWDGRRDSLWAQALTPLEHPDEQALPRAEVVARVADHEPHRALYADLFGPLPDAEATTEAVDQAFANIGKSIAAFERTLVPKEARFDRFAAALRGDPAGAARILDAEEQLGLRLFIGRASCIDCHLGPLLTNQGFHNIGTVRVMPDEDVDQGRWLGVRQADADPFNCLGAFSDAPPAACGLRFAKRQGSELVGAFKVPGLRNAAATAPYMHDGQLASLEAVVAHYVAAADADRLGHQEIVPLALDAAEQRAIVRFLGTLTQD